MAGHRGADQRERGTTRQGKPKSARADGQIQDRQRCIEDCTMLPVFSILRVPGILGVWRLLHVLARDGTPRYSYK